MLIFWFVVLFVIGAAVGSFLNVCIYRLPYEKSLLWPGSHCGNCFQPIRWQDNIPLLSYWTLRGRCRVCGTRFSVRYFFVELGTALALTGLFYLDVVQNLLRIPFLDQHHADILEGDIPLAAWTTYGFHALLVCFLIVTSVCDLDHMEIPLSVTVTGTICGLIGGTLLPWSFPGSERFPQQPQSQPIPSGAVPWPLWDTNVLPDWMQPGSWQLGLATSLAGVLAGALVLRAIRFLFSLGRGIEGMGLGDADLMMMAGAFLGWQATLTAFFVGVIPGLFFGLAQLFVKGDKPLPFGPSLALGVVLTLLFWPALGRFGQPVLFDGPLLGIMAVFAAVMLLVLTFLLRLIRGRG